MEEKELILRDNKHLFYRVWRVDNPVATVHINHGMAEHSLRYDSFAKTLNQNGFVVFIQDHRGHGRTKTEDEKGWFSENDGWNIICDDSYELDQEIKKEYPLLPHFIFGHSMGSFLTRTNLERHSDEYKAAVIMGTGASMGIVGKMGHMIASSRKKKYGSKYVDEFINKLAFGSYPKKFDYKTEGVYCWLSSDRDEVKKYENDPDCGFTCTTSFYMDLMEGIEWANNKKEINKIRKDLPLLFVSGSMDPVGSYSKGVIKAANLYKDVGIKDVRIILYPEGRHEILNDKMRDQVASDVVSFYKEFL